MSGAEEREPELLGATARVRCPCGEVVEFHDLDSNWTHIEPCYECGRRVTISLGAHLGESPC